MQSPRASAPGYVRDCWRFRFTFASRCSYSSSRAVLVEHSIEYHTPTTIFSAAMEAYLCSVQNTLMVSSRQNQCSSAFQDQLKTQKKKRLRSDRPDSSINGALRKGATTHHESPKTV